MRRVLVTGVSGVGKSTVVAALRAEGVDAVDLDDPAYSTWMPSDTGGPSPDRPGEDWVWRDDAVTALLDDAARDPLVVAGTSATMGPYLSRFDVVVLLSAPAEVMAERLRTRTTNPYGRDEGELAVSLGYKQTVEPLLRRAAHVEIDTAQPLDRVTAEVRRWVRNPAAPA